MKYFRFSMDFVLWEISHANLIMLMATIPKYGKDKAGAGMDESFEVDDISSIEDFLKT